jgi:hypothetical protein
MVGLFVKMCYPYGSENRLGDDGVKSIVAALEMNKIVTDINLSRKYTIC